MNLLMILGVNNSLASSLIIYVYTLYMTKIACPDLGLSDYKTREEEMGLDANRSDKGSWR